MTEETLRLLEFDRIVEAVRSFAQTPLGKEKLDTLHPLTDPGSVRVALAQTTEGVRYLKADNRFSLKATAEIDKALTALAVEGRALEPKKLLAIVELLTSVTVVRRAITQASGGPFPSLQAVLDGCQSFKQEISQIVEKVDPAYGVLDNASKQLKGIRDRLRRQRDRLRGILNSYLKNKETSQYLQEQVITERNGRYVLVLKSEHKHSIPGIVHASSGSGASLFLEPLSTVDINNEIVAIEQTEHVEIQRILLELANNLRKRAVDLRTTLTAAAEIDFIQARSSFSLLLDGVEPSLCSASQIKYLKARHPLLIPEVQARLQPIDQRPAGKPVPNDVVIDPPNNTLVITGPNTGGKTVALKTAGLLALMAQAGLHIPADHGSMTPVFRTVFSDIGDEQSISDSLSTFSAHITNIISLDRRLKLPALVLLDEIGTGTDPIEGGALATAIVDHFRQRGTLIIVTTHNDALKSYASTTPSVVCSGMGFNAETYAPTYQLLYGSPGRSLGLEIAARLGMPESIIDAAKRKRGYRETQLAEQLTKVDENLQQIETERKQLFKERQQLTTTRDQLISDRRAQEMREASFKERMASRLNIHVREARTEIDAIVHDLKSKASELARARTQTPSGDQTGLSTGDAGQLRTTATRAISRIAAKATTFADLGEFSDDSHTSEAGKFFTCAKPPEIGEIVIVDVLGIKGRMLSLNNGQAEVDVLGKRLQVKVQELRPVNQEEAASTSPDTPTGGVTVIANTIQGDLSDLNVIGCNVEEAQETIEKHLDRAILQEQQRIRIIHGHGTGRLRRSIGDLLKRHPQVVRFTPAPPEQGGSAVTLVDLKD
tara:strand:+ start:1371 stop:3866 length:2496 start_codon:yes stop_codon:yes gene_type:complete